jgi:hypothetical protein
MKRALAASWGWLLVGAIVTFAPAPLTAQTIPYSAAEIPLVPGTSRDPQAEAELRAAAVPDSTVRWVRAYRIGASIEALFKWYLNRLGGDPGDEDVDSTPPKRAGLSNIVYRVAFHSFNDVCADPPGPVTPGSICHLLRQGKNQRNALSNARIPYEKDHWIDSVTFTWFRRDTTGALLRIHVLIRDIGLSQDWKHYTPLGRLVLMDDVVEPGRPGSKVAP